MLRNTLFTLFLLLSIGLGAQESRPAFQYLDVFDLEYASDPQISPDGSQVVYRRMAFDIMKDNRSGNLWVASIDGSDHRKLTSREVNESQARWSPDGKKLAFVSSTDEGSELYLYWTDGGQVAKLSSLQGTPGSLAWSPDGKELAFTMFVPKAPPVIAKMPAKPRGAQWAGAARVTDRLKHEADGLGYMPTGFRHIFMIPAEGGTARQITSGNFNHGGSLSFSPNGQHIYFSANRSEEWEYDFRNSEVYKVDVRTRDIEALTDQQGPDAAPIVSPDGKKVAFISFKDKVQTYQLRQLYIMNPDGSGRQLLTGDLDRSVSSIQWSKDGEAIYFMYDDKGNTKVAQVDLNGKVKKLADNLGGTSIGRPYGGGSYSVSDDGKIAYTYCTPYHPSDIGLFSGGSGVTRLTNLNQDVLGQRTLGKVEEVWYKSMFDGRDVQGWIIKPPFYDASKKYPVLVENHGGPISNYGDRFTPELQLYAAEDYIVFYPNPRGSTSYGEEFGNLLYHNYPGQDYNDVMDGVDHLIKQGLIDEDELYVTGGSAGGIMTAWIIGQNNRFKAAVVQKPVVNWISKTLVADNYYGYAYSRYPGQPWENFEEYWKFSPLSLVANIETPTMVMVGMDDLRTPPSEAKQLYHALKLRKIETVLVEIPGASHGIANRPSNMISKVEHTLAWFRKYRDKE